jgi:serine/threonine protein kinase
MLGRLALNSGSVFAGQFRVIQPIASGGMGTVYLVEQLGTGQRRALKIMNGDLVDDPRSRERFAREAQLAAMIESEHVAAKTSRRPSSAAAGCPSARCAT